ncbi:hypothetical protein [Sediminispirochaeta bajacaliforniensis]|uniref:hypothetical protein n=1 Tax=Sediminispirochaeta bajacaliforniensis TaxID=148 RepID=UPI0003696CF4|nr:hypothetical protein [Sediminispirochaeta bajacaliforniensis]
MSIGVTAVLVLLGVVALEFGLLWFLFKRNARLREENRAAEAAIDRANDKLDDMQDLMGDRQENRQEAADEKRRVDETDDSDLFHDANALFPDKLSDD